MCAALPMHTPFQAGRGQSEQQHHILPSAWVQLKKALCLLRGILTWRHLLMRAIPNLDLATPASDVWMRRVSPPTAVESQEHRAIVHQRPDSLRDLPEKTTRRCDCDGFPRGIGSYFPMFCQPDDSPCLRAIPSLCQIVHVPQDPIQSGSGPSPKCRALT